jgi:hypothetical protein
MGLHHGKASLPLPPALFPRTYTGEGRNFRRANHRRPAGVESLVPARVSEHRLHTQIEVDARRCGSQWSTVHCGSSESER